MRLPDGSLREGGFLKVHRIAAFSDGERGGNPAGVVVCPSMPDPVYMQALAAEAGYSETAFLAPLGGHEWRVRYFAPCRRARFPPTTAGARR